MRTTITISIPTATDYWGPDVTPEEVPVLVPRFRGLIGAEVRRRYPDAVVEFLTVEHNTGTGVRVEPEDEVLIRDIEQMMSDLFVDTFPVQ